MRATKTFSVLFWADLKNAVNDQALIYARITINGKRTNISLKRKGPISLWDAKKKQAKGHTIQAKQVNNCLEQARAKLYQHYQELEYKGELVTAKLIKAKFLGEDKKSKTLLELIDYHSKKIEGTLASGSIRNFDVSVGYLKRFLEREMKTDDINLKQLNYKFISDFENFLHHYWPKGHPKAMGHNTVMKHIQRLRKIITLGYHIEWLDRDPFVRWKPTFERKQREFLSENELSNLESYRFPLERLDRVRDLFVFSCYTGISYSDLIKLTHDNIHLGIDGGKWIMTTRQKTKTSVKVPLLDKAQELIDKYTNHPITQVTATLLPVITNEKLNLYLKEVADACGIRKNLTFHMSRHTFATTITLSNGVPIETVSKLLGHTKLATTQIYARVIERKVSEDMNVLSKKLNKKPLNSKKKIN
ncbi:MAG TPA: site-specific integrase [Flavobacteriaceae bacterium]|nr:site-specific integrase [Flavobacteriaceae bacterium]